MNIGTNIYTLRKEKKITQVQLAEKLGVSEQAISKWENNQCAPDVSLFPIIADYFGVSIDRLFGYHVNSYSNEVKSIIKAADESMGTYKEIEIISEGLKRFPNSPDLKIYLAFSLSMVNRMSNDENEKKEAIQKAIQLCTEVVDTCGENKQVDRALNMMARIYGEIGEYQKAFDVTEKLSGESYFFRIVGIARTLGYSKNDKELVSFVEKNLFDCWLAMDLNLQVLTSRLSELGRFDEVISFCKAHLNLLSVFDNGCSDFYATHKFFATHLLAHAYRKIQNRELCLETLYKLNELIIQVKKVEKCNSLCVSNRNPMYFSNLNDESQEEYISGFSIGNMLSAFDKFFGDDESYLRFKKSIDQ